jgi:methionyl-tRNA formyltransferase
MINKELKICIFGTNMLAYKLAKFLKKNKIITKTIITISHNKAKKNQISDYDFEKSFFKFKKNIYTVSKFNLDSKKDINYLKQEKFDLGLCIGWQRLFSKKILSQFKFGIYGWHGSYLKLPDGAGRSPINWSIRLGKKKIYHHLFKYDHSIDNGDIYELFKINIKKNEYFKDIKIKINKHILNSSFRLIKSIQNKKLVLKKQLKKKRKIIFPKITFNNCKIISQEMSVKTAYDLIRSSSHPFKGTYLSRNSKKILIIFKSTIINPGNQFKNLINGSLFFYNKFYYLKLKSRFLRIDEYKLIYKKININKKIICD